MGSVIPVPSRAVMLYLCLHGPLCYTCAFTGRYVIPVPSRAVMLYLCLHGPLCYRVKLILHNKEFLILCFTSKAVTTLKQEEIGGRNIQDAKDI